jgi:hypothetical protein
LANTEAFRQSPQERKKVEMRFAHMKRILKLDRLRLRGLSGAKDEVLLTATAQNLRRLANSSAIAGRRLLLAWCKRGKLPRAPSTASQSRFATQSSKKRT